MAPALDDSRIGLAQTFSSRDRLGAHLTLRPRDLVIIQG
jgi:hypothetical protein